MAQLSAPNSPPGAAEAPQPQRRRGVTVLILISVLCLAAGLRLVNLTHAPPGLHQDEAANAWNAYCLLKTGQDQVGVRWPIFYSRCLGANRSTLYLYTLIPFQAVGGMNVVTTRLPAALGGILTVLLAFYVGTRLFGRSVGLLAAGLLAVNPWHLQLSRWGHEAGLCQLLVMAPVAALLWANLPLDGSSTRRPRPVIAAFAGGLTGICCYGYPAIRVFLPLFLTAVVIVTWSAWRRVLATPAGRRAVLAAAIAFAVTFGPLVWVHLAFPEHIGRRANQVWAWEPGASPGMMVLRTLARYPGHYGPDFLFRVGDLSASRFPTGAGQFHWYAGPMMILGLVVVLARCRRSPPARVLLVWVLLYPAGDLLFGRGGMHALRSFPGAAGLILLSALGVVSAVEWLGRRRRSYALVVAGVVGVTVLAVNVRFVHGYFGEYAGSPGIYHRFHTDLVEACEMLRPRLDEFDAVFCTAESVVQPYIITLVALRYEPRQWFLDSPPALTLWDWDVYPGYGKMHFLFGDLGTGPLDDLRSNDRDDRVLFIIRPNELGLDDPIHKIIGPLGETRLWICEETL